MKEDVVEFFDGLWKTATIKHEQGLYNTVCLAVLLALPLMVLVTTLVVCCHCCCCRQGSRCLCCCGRGDGEQAKTDKKRKKNSSPKNEDLWISVKMGPMTPDRVALNMV
ncbi:uncharacterized protein KIAA0040 homolog [Denticeps clupeoides]|uniref:uncharacterized protein KIAA0040 homolog n=1 Tax=Denticeps clupeoides TaxID=299321 RepID=UPI0010A43428|nr:uncharacterized protein KIAA0040 homolog [Denticeps clupeoides]XP_028833124.1 uncharacterized protein KIAA0040 homolog [Denticeps clupeoides]